MSTKALLRIVVDIIEFNKNRPDDIYISFNKNDVTSVHSMIVGPKNTPYFGGYFFFELKFPANYPDSPPSVNFLTTDGRVRFNPNLYACGKVCLSIIGTWTGPKWEPVMTLKSVLLSIQSLMGEVPLNNEPGYVNTPRTDDKVILYSNYVQYNTYMIGIQMVLDGKFKISAQFYEHIVSHLNTNYEELMNNVLSLAAIHGIITVVQFPYNINMTTLNFEDLCYKFIKCTNKFLGKKN